MLKQKILIFLFVLISKVSTEEPSNLNVLDACYDNSPRFYYANICLETIQNIKEGLVQDPQTKKLIMENPSEREKAKSRLLKCIEELLRQNQFKALGKFIEDVLDPLDYDLSNNIKLMGNQIKREIDNIVNKAHAKKNMQIINPVFQWIQNESHLFLQIKFAHRHDAPGCLEVKTDRIEFGPNGFYFSAYGIQAQQPIHFVLNLTFYNEINPEQSTWNLESVGRLFVSIAKANPDVWVYLLKDNERLPGMRLWWEMKDNYKDAMKKYEKLLEKEEEAISREKKSKGKKEKKQEGIQQPEEAASNPQPVDDEL